MSDPVTPLEQALALSQAMLEAARAADWERLLVLEAKRHPLVMRRHPTGEDSQRSISRILAYDRELHALVSQARDAVAEQWDQARERSRAIAAYGR